MLFPTPPTSAQRIEVSGGTSNPAILAIRAADCPTHCGFTVQFGMISSLPRACFWASLARYALRSQQVQDPLPQRLFRHHGLLAGAHRSVIERLARHDFLDGVFQVRRAVDQHRNVAGPTPKAGLPLEYAAFTTPAPPVERITPVRSCRISALVASSVALSTHWIISSGAPASTAAWYSRAAVQHVHWCARGCGLTTMALPALSEIRIL